MLNQYEPNVGVDRVTIFVSIPDTKFNRKLFSSFIDATHGPADTITLMPFVQIRYKIEHDLYR
jgi:hypothetical protein